MAEQKASQPEGAAAPAPSGKQPYEAPKVESVQLSPEAAEALT